MFGEFQNYLQEYQMVAPGSKTIIGVSGGVDSVVLCHLFKKSGLSFAIAHCNFKLRGTASDEDALFVNSLAEQLEVPCYKIDFDTKDISTTEKTSIQLTARQLRYTWFQKLMIDNDFQQIATAHHINDRIETFLYHFTKGTGIRGLRSIEPKIENIIRPLLFASKESIESYAKNNAFSYREDASNLSAKYNRNKIRIEAVPVLKSINPALEQSALTTFQNLEDTEQLFLWAINEHKKTMLRTQDGHTYIDFQKIKNSIAPRTLLYELITPFGFTSNQVNNIFSEQTRESGAQFFAPNYRLIINRNELIITAIEKKQEAAISIPKESTKISTPNFNIEITYATTPPEQLTLTPDTAWLDGDLLQFPLTLRHWEAGDYFHPYGMKGQRQKLKKFLTNQKASLLNKENTKVLLSDDQICWVVGWRIDERFKIRENTKRWVRLRMVK